MFYENGKSKTVRGEEVVHGDQTTPHQPPEEYGENNIVRAPHNPDDKTGRGPTTRAHPPPLFLTKNKLKRN